MPETPSVIGRYEVRDRIGHGGMGALYLALDPAIDRLVALKLLHIDSDDMRTRFLREARSAGRLQHQNIVTIHDVGEHDGQPFIAMEYVNGETLADLVSRRAPMSVTARLDLIGQLCDGLDYAHQAGLVHRDIKPANLMVVKETGALKILDFGIARHAEDSNLTAIGTMVGTPNYMSPEQALGEMVDHRSDIFAVGAVMYELLAYCQAFPGKEWHLVLRNILEQSPTGLVEIDPNLDPRLDGIVSRAMQRDPGERYQDLAALREDVAAFHAASDVGALVDTDRTQPMPTPTPRPRTTRPKSGTGHALTDQARLRDRRRAKVVEHVRAAHEALERGDVDAAETAAEEASLLDVDDTQVISLLDALGAAQQTRVFDLRLTNARARLSAKELTEALTLVDQALELRPDEPSALDLRGTVVEAFAERDRTRERERMVERTLADARQSLATDSPDAALRMVSEALAFDPENEEAGSLKQEALLAVEQRRRQADVERSTRRVLEIARREFDDGDHTVAFERLEQLSSTQPAAKDLLRELRAEAAAHARQVRSPEAVREREAQWVREQLDLVRGSIVHERWEDASSQLGELRARSPESPELGAMEEEVTRGRVLGRTRAEVADLVADARRCAAAGDHVAALSRVDAALALSPDDADVTALGREIESRVAEATAQQDKEEAARRKAELAAIGTSLDAAEAALRNGRFDDALALLDDVRPEVATASQKLRFGELRVDAGARAAEARVEAAARKKKLREETRQRMTEGASRVASTAGQFAGERRTPVVAAVAGVVAVLGWLLWPTSPPPTPTSEAAQSVPVIATARGPNESLVARPSEATTRSAPAVPTDPDDPGDAVPAEEPAGVPQSSASAEGVAAALASLDRGDFAGALARLDALNGGDGDVQRARMRAERAWNDAARETADRARALALAGDFEQAFLVMDDFAPEHGFVDSGRDDVNQAWAAVAADISREAVELAAAGDHQAAVALLQSQEPPHPRVLETLADLEASPSCPAAEPLVHEAMSAFHLEPGVDPPGIVGACDGPFRVDIQNALIRFGAGCQRASATAFVPVLCEGSAEWSEPVVLRFVLDGAGASWSIREVVEEASGRP